MTEKRLTNLFISSDIIDYFTRKATQELEDECESINKITIQRKRSGLMVDALASCYESDDENDE